MCLLEVPAYILERTDVTDEDIADAVLTWDDTDAFQMRLPQTEAFSDFDLTVDQSKEIEKIETNR